MKGHNLNSRQGRERRQNYPKGCAQISIRRVSAVCKQYVKIQQSENDALDEMALFI